jgi:hypothetical protein
MKQYFLFFAALGLMTFIACDKDEDPDPASIYEYHAHIHQPTNTAKMMDDTLQINVEFESHTGEPVHHINVRIFNKVDSTEVYNKPDEPHVHDTSGSHTYTDEYVLSTANGFSPGTWVLEAMVWGHEDGLEEVAEQVEFTIVQ